MADTKWRLSGEYFENCNCSVVCPCLISPLAPLTSKPTEGDCHVVMVFHIDSGRYGEVGLDGLNVAMIGESHGAMADGNMTGAAYIDLRADAKQAEALGAIFSGAAGGPMAALAPLFGKNLGAKMAHIEFKSDAATRSADIADVMHVSVQPLPSMAGPGAIMWGETGHPFNPTKLGFGVGGERSTYADYGMLWNNSGRNGHFASINWAN
jgi:hypothetical protein